MMMRRTRIMTSSVVLLWPPSALLTGLRVLGFRVLGV